MGACRGRGKSRPSPPLKKKFFWLYWGPLCYFFFIYGSFFATFFSFLGAFSPWGAFLLYGGGLFFWLVPAPLRKFLRAPMIARRVREHAIRNFLCDRNLVSSGHVLLRFCLKNGKNNDKL